MILIFYAPTSFRAKHPWIFQLRLSSLYPVGFFLFCEGLGTNASRATSCMKGIVFNLSLGHLWVSSILGNLLPRGEQGSQKPESGARTDSTVKRQVTSQASLCFHPRVYSYLKGRKRKMACCWNQISDWLGVVGPGLQLHWHAVQKGGMPRYQMPCTPRAAPITWISSRIDGKGMERGFLGRFFEEVVRSTYHQFHFGFREIQKQAI